METIEAWNERPDVAGARLADPDMGAENRRIAPFGPCPGVEFVTLEGIVQPFPLHFHDFWTIGQMVGGGRRMRCRAEEHVLGPDDFVLFEPGEVHGCEPVGKAPLAYRSIVVPDELFSQVVGEALGVPGPHRFKAVVTRDVSLSACMARLYAFAWSEGADPLEEEEALLALLARVARCCEGGRPASSSPVSATASEAAVARARELVDDAYAAELTLADLAQAAGLSRFALIRAFSDETGLTPHRYLQAVRANRARDLLAAGDAPAEAAARAGFSDQAHMTRVFKSFYGVTPGRYRSAARASREGR